MEIELAEETFEINYEDAVFVFRNDIRVFFKFVETRALDKLTSDIVDEAIRANLIDIKGIGIKGTKSSVKPSQFFLLPAAIVGKVRGEYTTKIVQLIKEFHEESEGAEEKNEGTNG